MPNFALIVTDPNGAEAYEEETFPLRSDALAHGKNRLLNSSQVAVGSVDHSGVGWIGCWSNTPLPASWEPAE